MSEQDVGFMVIWEGHPMHADTRKSMPDTLGVLYIAHRYATLYRTRAQAERAIRRTQAYATENAIAWSDKYRIIRVKEAARVG